MSVYLYPPTQVTLTPVPVIFEKDGVNTNVSTDSITPNNSNPLPMQMLFKKNGSWVFANYDTTTPSNSEAIPVNIVTVNGQGISTTVDLTGAQINVQLSHIGSSADSVQIGDGTNIAQVYNDGTNKNLRVHDKTITDGTQKSMLVDSDGDIAEIQPISSTISGGLKSIVSSSVIHGKNGSNYLDVLVNSSGNLLLTNDSVVKAQLQDNAGTAIVLGQKADSASVPVSLSSENANAIGSLTETAPASDTASSGLNGRLQRIAQRLSSLILLLPSSIGQKSTDASLSVTLPNDQTAIPIQDMSADGVTPFNSQAITRTAQKSISTIGTDFLVKSVASILFGFDGTQHKEVSLDTTGKVNIASSQLPSALGAQAIGSSLSITPAISSVFTLTETPAGTSTDSTSDLDHTTGATFTKPANAKKMVIFNNADATVANRIRFGSAPDWGTRQGAILGVGASTALLPAATFLALAEDSSSQANVSVVYFY